MKLSNKGYEFITKFEGIKNDAYLDSVKIPSIGIGFIKVNGVPVKMGDHLTNDQIKTEFFIQIFKYETAVNLFVKSPLTQNQFDSLVSFSYNLGTNALKESSLLKKINTNPKDPSIHSEFLKWSRAGGKIVQGLLNRRTAEADLFFTP